MAIRSEAIDYSNTGTMMSQIAMMLFVVSLNTNAESMHESYQILGLTKVLSVKVMFVPM